VTMKGVAGIVPARAGKIVLDGQDITRLSPEARVKMGIANVPQGRHGPNARVGYLLSPPYFPLRVEG